MEVENSEHSFVRLWQELERTREVLMESHRRFCLRNALRLWEPMLFSGRNGSDFVWNVCFKSEVEGYTELEPPSQYPLVHREWLRAYVAERIGIGVRKVDLAALDHAYSLAFPGSTPINIAKKLRDEA